MRAARSEEHREEANILLQQGQHPMVRRQAAARLGIQSPDVVGGLIVSLICPLLCLATLGLLVP